MTAEHALRDPPALADEHSVLVWQTAAYADDLTDAACAGHPLIRPVERMLGFLHYRLLPYLADEEQSLCSGGLRDDLLVPLLRDDHTRLRGDVENLEGARTRRLLPLAATVLVDRLDRHTRREEAWAFAPAAGGDAGGWAIPLLLDDEIVCDVLPGDLRDELLLGRLAWLRPGETVRLHAGHDLHPLWRRQQVREPGAHAWVYEQNGPARWTARVTRRPHGADY